MSFIFINNGFFFLSILMTISIIITKRLYRNTKTIYIGNLFFDPVIKTETFILLQKFILFLFLLCMIFFTVNFFRFKSFVNNAKEERPKLVQECVNDFSPFKGWDKVQEDAEKISLFNYEVALRERDANAIKIFQWISYTDDSINDISQIRADDLKNIYSNIPIQTYYSNYSNRDIGYFSRDFFVIMLIFFYIIDSCFTYIRTCREVKYYHNSKNYKHSGTVLNDYTGHALEAVSNLSSKTE